MSKMLFIFERDMPTISIMREYMLNLHAHDEVQSTFIYLTDIQPRHIDQHDVIIFMRPNNSYSWKLADNARKAGHTVVTFCDDDLLNLPLSSPTMPWRKKGLIRTLNFSDVVWSSNKNILKKYRELTAGKRIISTDTIIRSEELEGIDIAHKDNSKVKIVYAASPGHASVFEELIGPVLPDLFGEFKDKISLTFVSVRPDVLDIPCEFVAGMPLSEYREYMKKAHFDIGLAPLHSDEFSKCKYFNKFIEYTTQGIVGIYSNTEPYTYVVRNEENGLLADDSSETWLEILRKAIRDKELRSRCVENAIDYLRTNHSEDTFFENLRRGLPEIMETKREYGKCRGFRLQKILYWLFRLLDWMYLIKFYLTNTGIKGVIKKVKTHFIERNAYRRK